jgi:F0F1-type ATP synthase assembly protein I
LDEEACDVEYRAEKSETPRRDATVYAKRGTIYPLTMMMCQVQSGSLMTHVLMGRPWHVIAVLILGFGVL